MNKWPKEIKDHLINKKFDSTQAAFYWYFPNTPQNTGHTWQLLFNEDHSVIQTGDLLDNDNGTYSLTQEMNGSSTVNYLNISFSNHNYKYDYYLLASDTLKLNDHIEVDGLTYYFVKK